MPSLGHYKDPSHHLLVGICLQPRRKKKWWLCGCLPVCYLWNPRSWVRDDASLAHSSQHVYASFSEALQLDQQDFWNTSSYPCG